MTGKNAGRAALASHNILLAKPDFRTHPPSKRTVAGSSPAGRAIVFIGRFGIERARAEPLATQISMNEHGTRGKNVGTALVGLAPGCSAFFVCAIGRLRGAVSFLPPFVPDLEAA